MTIRPGEPWGAEVPRPTDLIIVKTDSSAVAALGRVPATAVGLAGGDLHTSLGSPGARDPVLAVEVDGIRVDLGDGGRHLAIAHVVVRRSWWRGAIVAIMNVDHLGAWNLAPRAHPNDGLADVIEVAASMSVRDRWAARRRLPTGTHIPHPEISTARVRERAWRFEAPHGVWVDGIRVASATEIRVEVEPDLFTVHV